MQTGQVDVTINSVHKNLGALAGAALVNVGHNSRICPHLIKDIYTMNNTTSNSVYMLLDTEGCVRSMIEEG